MWQGQTPPVDAAVARDQGLRRLRSWTTFSAVLAAAGTLVFALLAAGTFPGRSAVAADSSLSPAAQPTQDSSGDQGAVQPQQPPGGFFGSGGGGGGGGRVRSGGS
jgi:hypothetical protein